MANTPDIFASQGHVVSAVRISTADLRVSQGFSIGAINFPTPHLSSQQARSLATVRASNDMQVSQGSVLVAARGRTGNPRVRAWTITLDGHDFYILRLGDKETLVYDTSSKQWVDWDSFGGTTWNANTGINWIGGQIQALSHGSNIVIGDDTFGLLWFLDPEQPFDQHPDVANATQQISFDRVVMAQQVARGREAIPCYALFLNGDNFGTVATEFEAGVKLETSDDGGKTYYDHGTITVTPETVGQVYEWLSLGQIEQPGRLFKITDSGVFAGVYSAVMNDGG